MTDFFQRNNEICALRDWGMTLQEIADLYGISRERARSITVRHPHHVGRLKAERDPKRHLARMFYAVLPLIEEAATRAARKKWGPHRFLVLRRQFPEKWPKKKPKKLVRWRPPPPRDIPFRSPEVRQAELQELAKHLHWSRVVYANGSDEIVDIL